MKSVYITKKGNYYFLNGFFEKGISAGFTDTAFKAEMPRDAEVLAKDTGAVSGSAFMNQLHAADVKNVSEKGIYNCDGLITSAKDFLLIVKTADCMPLIIADEKNSSVGVIHMGWRSALSGILNNMKIDPGHSKVFAGPGLRKCCYKVGPEFVSYGVFRKYVDKKDNGYFFDPIGFIKGSLAEKGFCEDNFQDSGICSYCSDHKLFSYRRGHKTERTMSFVMRNT